MDATQAGEPARLVAQLRADCGSCAALCCVALGFTRSADFAFDKPSAEPCVNLDGDLRCRIHAELRPQGFPGCTVFDCFGAGQQVTQVTMAGPPGEGRDWRAGRSVAAPMFAAFATMRHVQELRYLLADARRRGLSPELDAALAELADRLAVLANADLETVCAVDPLALRAEAGPLLGLASAALRGPAGRRLGGKDLAGQRMRGAALASADLRGALLIGADLRGADLLGADLLGADLRAADVSGADLNDALFLTQPQLDAATGDATTRISPHLGRPNHWPR